MVMETLFDKQPIQAMEGLNMQGPIASGKEKTSHFNFSFKWCEGYTESFRETLAREDD